MKWAPIMGRQEYGSHGPAASTSYGYVPWDVAKRAHDQYAAEGYKQPFQKLNSRGGFCWDELNWLLGDERTLGPLRHPLLRPGPQERGVR